ncbi:MAG: hypothetical protein QM783_19935 [Phycisphaerales bacterium]
MIPPTLATRSRVDRFTGADAPSERSSLATSPASQILIGDAEAAIFPPRKRSITFSCFFRAATLEEGINGNGRTSPPDFPRAGTPPLLTAPPSDFGNLAFGDLALSRTRTPHRACPLIDPDRASSCTSTSYRCESEPRP